MFTRVAVSGDEWLVDVGYPGPSYIEPLLVSGAAQEQYGCQYQLVDHAGEITLKRRGRVTPWSDVYTFTMKARQWSDWKEFETRVREISSNVKSHQAQSVLCGRAVEDGQVVLKGRRYLTVRDGKEQVRSITKNDEHQTLISRILTGALD